MQIALDITQIFDVARSLGIRVGNYDESTGQFLGQDFVAAPVMEPDFPTHISNIDAEHLGDLLHCQSEWAGHLDERLAEYSAQLRITEELKDRIERKLFLDSDQEKVASKRLEVKTNPEYTEVVARHAMLKSILDLIKAALNKAERRCASLSKQVALRELGIGKGSVPTISTPLVASPTINVSNFAVGKKIVRSP